MSKPVTLVAVGDLQLGDSPTSVGYGFFSRYSGVPIDDLLAAMRPALDAADILFGNLETTLLAPPVGETRRSALQLRGEPGYADALRRAGFTVLNVANNHAVQHGEDSFQSTVTTLRSAGIACCGVRGRAPWASEPVLLRPRDATIGVLGYCLRPRQYGSDLPPYAEGSLEDICADVKRLREMGATVIVSLHWGEEFVAEPSHDEIAMAHAIVEAGASVILGHHPHVTRPVERYGTGVIAYSLGNFMGDMVWYEPFRRGAVLCCRLSGNHVIDASTIATRLGDDYRPVPAPHDSISLLAAPPRGLESAAYQRAIAVTLRRQRLASYRAAVFNLSRTPFPIIAQLAMQTLRNKLDAIGTRITASVHHEER